MKPLIASDFDGTITTRDTLPLMLKHCFGHCRFWWGVLCCLPWLVLYKLRLFDGGKAKEVLLSHFVKGMPVDEFEERCKRFAIWNPVIYSRPEVVDRLQEAIGGGQQVAVVTASADLWVKPWLDTLGLEKAQVVATRLEVDDQGCLTGRLASHNCNGAEKWRRLCEAVPDAPQRPLTVYGDSRGDHALIQHAATVYYRHFDTPFDQLSWLQRYPGRLFGLTLLAIALYLLLGVFYGMDVADAGFYLTFYDNIFTHPASVEYNFMYYLSGVLGGTLQSLFPGMGIVGMRLAGVALCLLTATVVYYMLRRHVDERALALGCALVAVAFVSPPLTLSYDLCTVLLYVCAIALLWRGWHNDSAAWVMLAGVVAGLNVLVRIPNVLGLSMGLLPLMAAFIASRWKKHAVNWKETLLLTGLFYCSAVLALCVVALLMPGSHFQCLVNVVDDLRAIAADTSGTASHSTSQMLLTQGKFYLLELYTGVKLAVPVLAYWAAHHRIRIRWARYGIKVLCLAVLCWFVARMHPLQPLWLASIVGGVWLIVRSQSWPLKWAVVLGLGMMLVMPLGSDGAYNNGSIIAWLAAPLACEFWRARSRWPLVVVFMASCVVHNVVDGAYFDGGPLTAKRWQVDNPRSTLVFTTSERAQVLNRLLKGIEPYIQPHTTLMAYGSIPTLNYLTHTRPYLGCSWVEQLSATMLKEKLERSATSELPPVLRQKFNTLGMEWGTPSETYLTHYDEQSPYHDDRKLVVINGFLQAHRYTPVYEDDYFVLYLPLSKH